MKFNNLHIESFLSIGQADVSLRERGLVLIEGKNTDDTSAKSNGAGKSSLVDALCWCLYGKTARGLSTDDVINKKSKSCCVTVTLEEKNETYCVTRTRKGKSVDLTVTHQHEDVLGALGEPPATIDEELTKGTVAETQATVEQIIGCPYNVFVAAVYAGQEAMPDLPSMTDKQLKELIESVIGVERLTVAYDLAKTQLGEAKNEADSIKMRIDMVKADIASREAAKKASEANDADFYKRNADRKEEIKKQIEDKEKAFREASEKDADYEKRQKEIEARVDALTTSISNISAFQKKAAEAEKEASKAVSGYINIKCRFDSLKQQAVRLSQDAKNVASRVGTKCSECGKVYTEDDIAEAKQNAVEKAKHAVTEAQTIKAEMEKAEKVANEAKAKYEAAKEAIPDTSVLDEKSRLLSEHAAIKAKRELPGMIRKDIGALEKELHAIFVYEKGYTSMTDTLVKEIAEKSDALNKLVDGYNLAEEKVSVLEVCKEIYGPTGVRQHVLDTITPVLNDRTARYLDVLSDGKLQAIWTTLTRTKKGEVKEKFNIAVTNRVGGGSFESLSGGEKRKVRVACCLALQELVASRATKPIELFIADEVDHALDEAGVERLIGVLQEKADCCKSLFVISHNPLRNWIENVITVTKHDGISTVE